MSPPEPRYLPEYRQDEVHWIYKSAFRGESLCFVGVPGVGKSNVINYLRKSIDHEVPDVPNTVGILFCAVDATIWQRTPASLWQLMDNALRTQAAGLTPPLKEGTVVPISEEDRALTRLSGRLKWACQDLGYRVVFILDDADGLFETGPRTMLEQLNTLRSEGNREILSYVVFTKRLPHVLGRSYDLESSKFFDLIRNTHFALRPYTDLDALQMLKHLNSAVVNPTDPSELSRIQKLAGGHARLLRILFDLWVNEGPPTTERSLDYLGARPDVQQECERIFKGLHQDEQDVAVLFAHGTNTLAHANVVDHLERRGLLLRRNSDGRLHWFSDLMEHYLIANARKGGSR